jgi:hypothetical protein
MQARIPQRGEGGGGGRGRRGAQEKLGVGEKAATVITDLVTDIGIADLAPHSSASAKKLRRDGQDYTMKDSDGASASLPRATMPSVGKYAGASASLRGDGTGPQSPVASF